MRYAVLVDAGYLLAAGGWASAGVQRRAELDADCVGLVRWLQLRAADVLPERELLRLYWYDAAYNRQPTREQLDVADLDDAKLRLGHLTSRGEQKGVDAMVLNDLTTLARGRTIGDAILVTGDGDFVEAVSQAQREGCRVHVWGVRTPQNTVSPDLRREADRFAYLDPTELTPFLRRAPMEEVVASRIGEGPAPLLPSPPPRPFSPPEAPVWASLDPEDARVSGVQFARKWAGLASPGEVASVVAQRPEVPHQLHLRLLTHTLESAGLPWGTRLPYGTAETMREGFWSTLAELAHESPGP